MIEKSLLTSPPQADQREILHFFGKEGRGRFFD
jgi:hypothetical protein